MLELTLTSTIVHGGGEPSRILLSLAGIYSVMAFRIERRTREIGLRAALGADKLRIIIPMLKPVLIQVGLGISFAVCIIFLLGVVQSARGAAMVATFAVFTLVISILACAVPIRRALRVEPHGGAARGDLSRSGVGERRPHTFTDLPPVRLDGRQPVGNPSRPRRRAIGVVPTRP